MSQGAQALHVSGAKVAQDIQMDSNASSALHHMKEQLLNFQTENKKLADQLNCLVSLIKRSWSGDKHATTHLSNIVGIPAPMFSNSSHHQEGSIARPNSQINKTSPTSKTKCERNWERLALKLLEQDYREVEQEIREYQMRYIENRQAYMDAVLQDHQQNMARIPLHRKTENVPIDEVDSRFIKHTQALQRMGSSLKGGRRRVQSAGTRRKVHIQDKVERMDISLRDIVGNTPSSEHFNVAQGTDGETVNKTSILRRPQTAHPLHFSTHHQQNTQTKNAYNDASRYLQNNLYAIGENDVIKKQRPVSASSLRDGDIARSRPRSGRPQSGSGNENIVSPAFMTQRNERPMKYEATRPVYIRPKSGKPPRRNSTGNRSKVTLQPQTDVFTTSVKKLESALQDERGTEDGRYREDEPNSHGVFNNRNQKPQDSFDLNDDEFDLAEVHKPAVSVRVKSAFTRRPGFIDEFAEDEKTMRNMEADFKKTALSLQKRLGIDGNGFIDF